ncbi:MAG: nascent polypeptide-associated complex protein [Candidatus Diapherotrites archaeon]
MMFPGLGNDPKKMKQMLQQFGIKTEDLDANRVIIESQSKTLVIEKPSITLMKVQGQSIYTIIGNALEQKKDLEIPEADINLVAEQAKVSKEQALNALKDSKGDIAEAIQKLLEKNK